MAGDRGGRYARETREKEDDRWAWFVSGGGGCAGERKRAAAAGLSAEGEREGGGPWGKTDWAGVGERRSRAEERRE